MTRKIDGRKAVVINEGNQFTTYKEFALKHGYPDAYSETDYSDKRSKLVNGDAVKLLVSGTHRYSGYGTLWIVEKANGDRYIIGESGLDIKEAEAIENVTILTDELGLQREYREVKRKAAVGERIKATGKSGCGEKYEIGDILTVTAANPNLDFVNYNDDVPGLRDLTEYVVLEPTDIVIVDGGRYRLVERKANGGERVISTINSGYLVKGNVYTVTDVSHTGSNMTLLSNGEHFGICAFPSGYRVLEPVASNKLSAKAPESQPDVIGIIANLSTRLAEAERKIAELEQRKADRLPRLTAYGDSLYGTTISNVKADSTRYIPVVSRPMSRDDVIERAKADVTELEETLGSAVGEYPYSVMKGRGHQRVDYVVNREKRTVVALIRNKYCGDKVNAVGKAKAAPDDVFNTHIGRAIALRRALGLDVPEEYVNAPKPTEAKVGAIVRCKLTHKAYTVVPDFTWDGDKLSIEYVNGRGLKSSDGVYISDDSSEEVTA